MLISIATIRSVTSVASFRAPRLRATPHRPGYSFQSKIAQNLQTPEIFFMLAARGTHPRSSHSAAVHCTSYVTTAISYQRSINKLRPHPYSNCRNYDKFENQEHCYE